MKIELSDNKVFFKNNGSKKEIHPFWLRERVNGKDFVGVPADIHNFKNIEPVYETLPGWGSLPNHIESLNQCPGELKNFVARVEKVAGVRVSLISYGPDRNQTFKI